MTPLSQTILDQWQVRKTRKQKTAFIDFMKSQFPQLQVEEGGFGKNRNLILGDVASARVICTAHYDTPARMLVPNFITPQNILIYIAYALVICIPFLLLLFVCDAALKAILPDPMLAWIFAYLIFLFAMFYVTMGGTPNPHTANDNTSGVITLVEVYSALTEEEKAKTALVFFDNEEYGLLGSAWFAKKHKKDNLKEKLVLNFDCVSDGDHMLFVLNKPARKQYGQALEAAFAATGDKTCVFAKSSTTMYPSDQSNFPVNVGVAAMKKKPILGLYMDRIHTARDTIFQESNIHFLRDGVKKLLEKF